MSAPAEPEAYETHYEAIVAAFASLMAEGGGEVWIHQAECEDDSDTDDCPCHPVCVVVPGTS